MVDPIITASIVYASLFGLMAIGLTLTYITTKVPNFAYGSFVTVGMYTAFSLFRLQGFSPYSSVPIAFIVGSLGSAAMYLGILRTLARRGSSLVALMIATLAIDIAFVGIFGIFSDYLYARYRIIGAGEILITTTGANLFGSSVGIYQKGIPLIIMIITLLLFPQGLVSLDLRRAFRKFRHLRSLDWRKSLHLR